MNENTVELNNKNNKNKLQREKNKKLKIGFFRKIINYFKETKYELKQVSWSTRKETLKNTFVVILTVFISVMICYGFDSLISFLLKLIIK